MPRSFIETLTQTVAEINAQPGMSDANGFTIDETIADGDSIYRIDGESWTFYMYLDASTREWIVRK